jgi:hypothetical protein
MAASRSIALLAPTLAASLGLFATGCAAPGASQGGSADEMTLGESQSGTSVVLAEGGSLTLELPVTSGTGYVWEVQVEPRGLLQVPAEPVTVLSPHPASKKEKGATKRFRLFSFVDSAPRVIPKKSDIVLFYFDLFKKKGDYPDYQHRQKSIKIKKNDAYYHYLF